MTTTTKDKLKIILLKIGYSLIALILGVSLKTLVGTYLGHSIGIAWLGNSLILFPTLGIIYYIWQKKEPQAIQPSNLNRNTAINLDIRHYKPNTNDNNVNTSDEYKEIIVKKITIVNDSIRNGTLSSSEGAEIITSLNTQLSLSIETAKSSAKYETAKNDLLNLLNNDLISQDIYKRKVQELLDEHQKLLNPELVSSNVELDKSWTKESRVYILDNRNFMNIVILTISIAVFFSALLSLVLFILNKLNIYYAPSNYILACIFSTYVAISVYLFKRLTLFEIDPSKRSILFKTNYLLIFNRRTTIKFDDVDINLKVKKEGDVLDVPVEIIFRKSFYIFEIKFDKLGMPLSTFTELFTLIRELTKENQNEKCRKFI